MPDVETDWVEGQGAADGTALNQRIWVSAVPQGVVTDVLPSFLDFAFTGIFPAPWVEMGCDDGQGNGVPLYLQPYSYYVQAGTVGWTTEGNLSPTATGLTDAAARWLPAGVLQQRKWHRGQGCLLYQNTVAVAYVRFEVCQPTPLV